MDQISRYSIDTKKVAQRMSRNQEMTRWLDPVWVSSSFGIPVECLRGPQRDGDAIEWVWAVDRGSEIERVSVTYRVTADPGSSLSAT